MTRIAILFVIWIICVICAICAIVRMLYAVFTNAGRAWTIAKAFDRTGNATANGSDEEYISTRAERARKENRRWGCVLCKLLDRVDPGHCAKYAKP